MPKVRVPRKNITPGELVAVLSRRLGSSYQVESNGDGRGTVRRSQLLYANVSIGDRPGASVFRVHGGGFLFLRVANTLGTARRVADALRRSPEFRSLEILQTSCDNELPPAGAAGGSSVPPQP